MFSSKDKSLALYSPNIIFNSCCACVCFLDKQRGRLNSLTFHHSVAIIRNPQLKYLTIKTMEAKRSANRLSDSELSTIVQNKFPSSICTVTTHSLRPLSESGGLLGEHAILDMTVSCEATEMPSQLLSFFVKFFPRTPSVAEFAEGTGAFRKEAFIYKLFDEMRNENIDSIESCTSRCYFTDPKKFMVMDNLGQQDYKPLNKHETLNHADLLVVLESLSKLHASSFIYEEKLSEKMGRIYRIIEEHEDDLEESFFNDREGFPNKIETDAAITGILKMTQIFGFPATLKSGKNLESVLKAVCLSLYQLVKPSNRFRNVICHGDIWATNFLIKRDGSKAVDCKFVDFQCGRYVPPAQDLMSLFYLTTSKEFRSQHMQNLIDYYYVHLEKDLKAVGCNINNILPYTEFLDSCEEQKVFGMVQTATYFPLILLKDNDIQKYFNDEELFRKGFLEDRSFIVLQHMNEDDAYKKRIRASIEDLNEYCKNL